MLVTDNIGWWTLTNALCLGKCHGSICYTKVTSLR